MIARAHARAAAARRRRVSFPEIEKFDALPAADERGAQRVPVVMEGCSKYCIVLHRAVHARRGSEPAVRRRAARSRRLAAQGVREITLLGQNVNAYSGREADGGKADLADADSRVAEIAASSASASRRRIRREFTQPLIEAYARSPKLVSHLHLPVQSGSDRVLALMKRGYTASKYKAKIDEARAVRPGISIVDRTSSSASRARPSRTSRPRSSSIARSRFRPVVQLHIQPAARYAGRGAAGDMPREVKQARLAAAAGAARRASARAISARWSARCSESSSRRGAAADRARARGTYREQPLGATSSAPIARRPFRRRLDHGAAAQFAEGSPRRGRDAEVRCLTPLQDKSTSLSVDPEPG